MRHARSTPWLKHATDTRVLGVLALIGLSVAQWQTYSVQQERDDLSRKLQREVQAHMQMRLLARDAEVQLATYILDNDVRREFVDERMGTQERREADLEREAEIVRLQKLAEADCVTPRSIMLAAGL